jgi:two-component system sensor histidine kinase/response regulator
MGFVMDMAVNGREAIEVLSVKPFDVVIMDVRMPVMDGTEATRMIRDRTSPVLNHVIPIVGVSADAMDAERQAGLQAGMNDYVSKPIDIERFEAVLFRVLGAGSTKHITEPPIVAETNAPTLLVFDRVAAVRRVGGDEAMFELLTGMFLDELQNMLPLLGDSITQGNAHDARLQAHTIKGAAGTLGAQIMQETARQIEYHAKGADLVKAEKLYQQLRSDYEGFAIALKEFSTDHS